MLFKLINTCYVTINRYKNQRKIKLWNTKCKNVLDFVNAVEPEGFQVVAIDQTRKIFGALQAADAVIYWGSKNPLSQNLDSETKY
ncbi:hypothetical protein [Spiroplasma endosymbiont of Nebria brevicollis]|uniref:hypothetical protein n=1 Tax=Spiroplasma endosymbiont of Nebria brevicollis TaxID=3066284 RepID=UPI00313BE644